MFSLCGHSGSELAVDKHSHLPVDAQAATNARANSFADGSVDHDGISNQMFSLIRDSKSSTATVEKTWQQTGRRMDRPVINATQPGCALGTDLLSQLFEGMDVEAEGENADNVSLSEVSESDENSDDEDIFEMKAATEETLSTEYQAMWLYRWHLAVGRLSLLLRDDVLLPLNPHDAQGAKVWTDVQSGIVLPPWHCAFLGCGAAEPTVEGC